MSIETNVFTIANVLNPNQRSADIGRMRAELVEKSIVFRPNDWNKLARWLVDYDAGWMALPLIGGSTANRVITDKNVHDAGARLFEADWNHRFMMVEANGEKIRTRTATLDELISNSVILFGVGEARAKFIEGIEDGAKDLRGVERFLPKKEKSE